MFFLTLTAGGLLSFNPAGMAQGAAAPATAASSQQPATSDARKGPDGILKAQGSLQFRKNGQLTRVERELKLSEGIVVQPDGNVTLADGSRITLQEGQLLTLDGKVQKAEAATGATGGKSPSLPNKPELNDKGNEGSDLEKKLEGKSK